MEIRRLWGVTIPNYRGKYLGLSSIFGKSRSQAFVEIKNKVVQKLQCWKEKFLSQGGCKVLLKAVVLAIPTYSMRCFLILKAL